MAAETTPDLSEFIAASKPKKAPCRVGAAMVDLNQDEALALRAACAQDRNVITAGAIVKWLEKRGHTANSSSVAHHRAGSCSCHA